MFKKWFKDEDGAITTDWVVLSALLVGMAVALIDAVKAGSLSLSEQISEEIDNQF